MSACTNASKIACSRSVGMPAPVSSTRTYTHGPSPVSRASGEAAIAVPALIVMRPASPSRGPVNLTAFATRFTRICRTRGSSAHTASPAAKPLTASTSATPCARACGVTSSIASATASPIRTTVRCTAIFPASMREKSSTSLTSISRWRALALARARCWRWAGVSGPSMPNPEQLQVADDGVDRRADLVAHRRQEPALRRVRGLRVGARRLGRLGRGLQQGVGRTARGEVARDLREAEQGARLVPERGQRDAGPERRAVAAHALALARVLAARGGVPQVLLGGAVVGAARRVEQSQVPTLGLVLGPPLDQARTLAPEGDDALRVDEEDRVVAHVLRERRERLRGDVRG